MSSSSAGFQPPERPRDWKLPLLGVAGLVIVALIVGGLVIGHGKSSSPAAARSQSSSAPPQPNTSASGSTVAVAPGVNGCLGGPDPTTAIEDAVKAPITPEGAVSFIATVLRWTTFSSVSGADVDTYGPRVLGSQQLSQVRTARTKVDAGQTFWADMGGAHYRLVYGKNSADVTLGYTAHGTANGAQRDFDLGGVYHLVVRNGRWQLVSQSAGGNTLKSLRTLTPLPGGC